MTSHKTGVRVPSHVHAKLVEDGYIVVDLRTGRYFALDEVGSMIWSALTEGRSVNETVELVIRDYEVGREQALVDVSSFLDKLGEAGLVETQQPE